MAVTSQIIISANSGYFLASSSGKLYTSYISDETNHSITLCYDGSENYISPTISLAQDPSSKDYIPNSIMLQVDWEGRQQEVVFVHKDAYECVWQYGTITLNYDKDSNPSGTKLTTVSCWGTVNCTPHIDTTKVPTATIKNLTIAGYWESPSKGNYNNPSHGGLNQKYSISWTRPSNYGTAKVIGYLVVWWKDNWPNHSDPTKFGEIGAMVMVEDNEDNIITITNPQGWFNGAVGHYLKHTVFTVYNRGIAPAINTARKEAMGKQGASYDGTAQDGNYDENSERYSDTIKTYSNYMYLESSSPSITWYKVRFYDESDGSRDLIVIDDIEQEQEYPYWSQSPDDCATVKPPTQKNWIPEGYKLDGWYKLTSPSAIPTGNILTTARVREISVNQNLYFLAALSELNKKIWLYNGSSWKQGIPWIYTGSEWKKGKSAWIYNGTAWKEEK